MTTSAPLTALRILVVDDDRDGAYGLATLLAFHGHIARACYHGLEAVTIARDFAPQVVFLDLVMPGLSGFDVCASLRQLPAAPMIVALTGNDTSTGRLVADKAGFDGYLLKPASVEDLNRLLAIAQQRLA